MVTMTRRRSAIMDGTERNRSALKRVFRRFLALARMRLAPDRGSTQSEAPGRLKVARCVSLHAFLTHVSKLTVRHVEDDD